MTMTRWWLALVAGVGLALCLVSATATIVVGGATIGAVLIDSLAGRGPRRVNGRA